MTHTRFLLAAVILGCQAFTFWRGYRLGYRVARRRIAVGLALRDREYRRAGLTP